jgi:hypothetical protein
MADRYVRASGGDDGATGATFALGWATLQFAFNTIAAGDTLYICGDFTISATVDLNGANLTATAANPIYIYGANSSGTPNAGAATTTITTTTDGLTTGLLNLGALADFNYFHDLTLDGGGSGKATYCANQSADYSDGCRWYRCRFTNSSGSGYGIGGSSYGTVIVGCMADNNGKGGAGSGFIYRVSGRGMAYVYGCVSRNNATYGYGIDSRTAMFGCLIYANGSDGINIGSSGDVSQIINCTIHGNSGDGIDRSSTGNLVSTCGCSIVNNGGYGYRFASGDPDDFTLVGWNHFHGNTTAAYSEGGGTPPGTNNQSGDPLFANVTAGSEDFTPGIGSPLIGNGMPGVFPAGGTGYMDIGAIQIRTAGGLILPPGLTGGMRG